MSRGTSRRAAGAAEIQQKPLKGAEERGESGLSVRCHSSGGSGAQPPGFKSSVPVPECSILLQNPVAHFGGISEALPLKGSTDNARPENEWECSAELI